MDKEQLKVKIDKCLDMSANLWNEILSIDEVYKNKMDDSELCRDIHDIQNRLMSMAYNNGLTK